MSKSKRKNQHIGEWHLYKLFDGIRWQGKYEVRIESEEGDIMEGDN